MLLARMMRIRSTLLTRCSTMSAATSPGPPPGQHMRTIFREQPRLQQSKTEWLQSRGASVGLAGGRMASPMGKRKGVLAVRAPESRQLLCLCALCLFLEVLMYSFYMSQK